MNFDEQTSRDPLDDLLAQARWPQPSDESGRRLEGAWEDITRSSRRRWPLACTMSAAAMLLLTAGTAWLTMRPNVRPTNVAVVEPPVQVQLVSHVTISRPPTPREMLLLRMEDLRRSAPTKRESAGVEVVSKAPSVAELVKTARLTTDAAERQRILAQLLDCGSSALPVYLEFVADRATKADALTAARFAQRPPMDALFAQLQSPRADLRVAAANVLGEIDGPIVTQKLIELITADRNRREAFLALASSRGTEAQNFLRAATESAELSSWARSAIAQTEIR
jgi:hypothetical protein